MPTKGLAGYNWTPVQNLILSQYIGIVGTNVKADGIIIGTVVGKICCSNMGLKVRQYYSIALDFKFSLIVEQLEETYKKEKEISFIFN